MPKNRNIRLLCVMSLLQGMVFYAPIATLYRQAAGINVAFGRAAEVFLPLALWLGAGLCVAGGAAYAVSERGQ